MTGNEKADPGGPKRIYDEFAKAWKLGFVTGIELLMLLSVYLGLFNLFPLPALDGGRLVFLGYEMVTRRRANPEDRGDGPHGRHHGARRRDDPRDAPRLPRLLRQRARAAAVAIAADVLDRIPTEPGVYLFKDARGTVVYVGKAQNLRTRVRQYFREGGDERFFVAAGFLGRAVADSRRSSCRRRRRRCSSRTT